MSGRPFATVPAGWSRLSASTFRHDRGTEIRETIKGWIVIDTDRRRIGPSHRTWMKAIAWATERVIDDLPHDGKMVDGFLILPLPETLDSLGPRVAIIESEHGDLTQGRVREWIVWRSTWKEALRAYKATGIIPLSMRAPRPKAG